MFNIFSNKENKEEKEEKENNDNTEKKSSNENDVSIQLELGDIIEILDPTNDKLNEQVFYIDYIDQNKMMLINENTLETLKLKINEDGVIGEGTITKLIIKSRSSEKGYARQKNLLPGTCVNIYFGGDLPVIITGEITNLENDMIEIRLVDDDVIYINFDYKGIPENLPIEMFEIREKPCTGTQQGETGEAQEITEAIPELVEDEIVRKENISIPLQLEVPLSEVKTKMREFIIKADQIQFGNEVLGPIVQYVDVYGKTERYSIESQTNDLLDELLSTIPNQERTNRVLNNIHDIIDRFVQLRTQFSTFDEYGNVSGSIVYKPDYKPLVQFFNNFNKNLFWILPIVKNIKKTYVDNSLLTEDEFFDINNINLNEDLDKIKILIENYKTNTLPNEQNKYSSFYKEVNPYFTPFDNINDEQLSDILIEKITNSDINVIIDNLGDFYSSVFRNNLLNTQRFVIQKYNLGLNKLEATNLKGSRFESIRVKLTQSDELYVKSILTLPEPFIRFSQINLPGTNILNRANLNSIFINYWQLLKNNTNVEVITVDNLNNNIEYNENNFVNNIKNYINSLSEDDKRGLTKSEIYNQFIETIIPRTRVLFNLMKKYIIGKYSIIDVVSYLEPFLIYTDNLTYQQYRDIVSFIYEKISTYNKNLIERSKLFYSLKNLNMDAKLLPFSAFPVMNIVSDKNGKRRELFDDYDIDVDDKINHYTNNEILRKIILRDSSELYSTTIILQNLHLRYPEQFTSIFENEKLQTDKNIKNETESSINSCMKKVIAKLYFSREELLNDNDRQIYFDKKYDDTNYGVLDDYEKDMFTKTPEEFILFLTNKLESTLKITREDADYLADTLINGFKKVINGQYAILKKINNNNVEFEYYLRKNNKWELDANFDVGSANKEDGIYDSNLLCNLQEKCISVAEKSIYGDGDKCETMALNKSEIKNEALKNILNEFDKKYDETKQEFEEKITKKYAFLFENINILTKIKNDNYLKYNNQKYKLGYQIDSGDGMDSLNAIVISPFAKYRDLILGQKDFVKQQQDIIKFVNTCTRSFIEDGLGPLGIKETPHWLYCIETNTELMPTFKYNLASAYLNDNSNYANIIELTKKNIGVISDDGDKWVDKYSGYTIQYIDFDVEEGYEGGFKISSRGIIEEDASSKIQKQQTLKENQVLKLDNPESIMISNVVTTLSVAMGINIEYQKDFIINCVKEVLKMTMPNEDEYKQKIKALSNKASTTAKAPMSYEDLYYTSILYYTLGMFLIAAQTSIPSLRTRKTFPGCVRSFSGFPFDGVGDMTSVRYLTCICYQIRKNIAKPWYVLKNSKEEYIEKKIILVINEYLLKLSDVKRKIDEKNEYLLTQPPDDIPKEYDVLNWTQFLPPLIPFKIKNLVNISSEFKKNLLENIKSGSKKQNEQILVIHSKIIQFSLAIQERIEDIVKKKDLVLSKMNNEYYLENACCQEKNTDKLTTIGYFEKEDSRITEYNNIVTNLSNIIEDINGYSNAVLLYSPINTKNIYPPIKKEFSEKTIYYAFIYYCNFTSLLPIPENILPLCNQKPLDIFNLTDSREEIIKKLKEAGINYSLESFLRMLQIISRNNLIHIDIDKTIIPSLIKFTQFLEAIKSESNEAVVSPELIKLFLNIITTFDNVTEEISKETKDLNNFLIEENESMKQNILDFLRQNKGREVSKNKLNEVIVFINNLSQWSDTTNNVKTTLSNAGVFNRIHFFKSFIHNFINIFPNIILNKVDYKENYIQKYLGLSKFHENKIKNIISEYYDKLRVFYNVPLLMNTLQKIQRSCNNLLKLSQNTPTFANIKNMNPIFNERTGKFLYEYYFLKVVDEYIRLSDDPAMIVKKVVRENIVGNLVSIDYLDEQNTGIDINVEIDDRTEFDTNLLSGDKKELKQKLAGLLIEFLRIMNSYKEIVDISYDQVVDRIFKLKEKEKNIITDRLKGMDDEARDADTILKINKLGVWSKGLQKGLTTYVKETYDEEREFVEQMLQYERKAERKIRESNMDVNNIDFVLDDLIEETEIENEIEREAYDMAGYTEDYLDGQFEGDDIDYNDYEDS
jgi:hypothetical protein